MRYVITFVKHKLFNHARKIRYNHSFPFLESQSISFIFYLLALSVNCSAQCSFEYDVCLKSVSFDEDTSTEIDEYIPIMRDNSSAFYEVPQFKQFECDASSRIRERPVAYVSGSRVKVKVKLETNCPESIRVRGYGPIVDGARMIFECAVLANEADENGYFTYEGLSNIAFSNHKIRHYDEFKVEWQWAAIDQFSCTNAAWISFGVSTNPLYVTLEKYDAEQPDGFGGQPIFFHTLLNFTCKAAKDETIASNVINKVWMELSKLSIKTADTNNSLFYYKQWTCSNITTASLIKYEDGQCGSWAKFFIDCLKVHSINHSSINDDFVFFQPKPKKFMTIGMLVRNYSFTLGPYSNSGLGSPYINAPKQMPYVLIPNYVNGIEQPIHDSSGYWAFQYSDFIDDNGEEGQGINVNPQSVFGNHQITNVNNSLLDPSYGSSYFSESSIRILALAGYYTEKVVIINEENFDLDGDGIADDINADGVISTSVGVNIYFATNSKLFTDLNFNYVNY